MTPPNWHSITGETCRPLYGFHDVEKGFVWSAHAFGLFFPTGHAAGGPVVFSVHNLHTGIDLTCRLNGRKLTVKVPPGEQRIAIDDDCAGHFVDFEITPKILLGSDVRELGLMFRGIAREAPLGQGALRFSPEDQTTVGCAPDGLDRLRAAAETAGRHVIGGFLREGWFKASYANGAFQMHLHAPPWRPPSGPSQTESPDTITCTCAVGGREEEITFRQDPRQSNLYSAALPIQRVTGQDTPLLEFAGPIDLEIKPNAVGRFRWQGVHWRGRGTDNMPVAANIHRVAGAESVENFLLHGASWLVKLGKLCYEFMPGGLANAGRIVDWGCGCARISRHFPHELRDKVVGVDIDPVNINWCRENIGGIRFETCSVEPPLGLADDSVDCLFAHSVLTHLDEERQNSWLAEIRRVLRPGGLAFLTVLAELSWYARFFPRGRTPEAIADYLETGFVNHGWQQDVGVDSNCPGAYVQISHGLKYILSTWSRSFEIVDWIDGFADLQTLVIVRKQTYPPRHLK